jgi:hypothetical protein
MNKLPKVLTQIEKENDNGALTPIFNIHKKKLADYDDNRTLVGAQEWDRRQRRVFVESRHEFNCLQTRYQYMG